MNILLFDKSQSELIKLAPILKENGHELILATDETMAKSTLSRVSIQMALCTARGGDDYLIKMLPEFRRLGDQHGTHIALLGRDLPDEFLVNAYNAGADAEIRMPISRALLLSRLRAAERSVKAAGKAVSGPAAPVELTPLDATAQSQAWQSSSDTLQNATSTFLTLPVTVNDASAFTQPITHACRIMLSNAQEQLEMRIAIGADERSAQGLAIHLFGPDGSDLVDDMLNELANILMGSMKASLGVESLGFTGGLPEALDTGQVLRPTTTYAHQQAVALHMGDAQLVVHIGLRSKANLFVSSGTLQEGMVLAKDVFNARGLVVLKSGTRLSRNMVEQLGKLLGPKSTVEVTAP